MHWEMWSEDPKRASAFYKQVEVPRVGQLSLFEDPDGRVLGLWKQT